MRTRTFDWDHGEQGWRPRGAKNFDAGSGLLTTHDVIEHITNDESFKAELMAFGVTLFGRGVASSIPAVASHDFANFLSEQRMNVRKASERWSKPINDEAERLIGELIRRTGKKLALLSLVGEADERWSRSEIEEALEKSKPWIRLGWRMAERAYGANSRHRVRDAFVHLMDAINNDHDDNMPVSGDTLTVNLDQKSLKFNLKRGHKEAA